MAFVRSSKFRHIFGTANKADNCYNGIKTEGTGNSNCAVSGKFIAIIKSQKIFILPLEKTGRQEENQLPYIDCSAKILDVKWSPFNDCLLASGDENGTVNIWEIPASGLKDNLSDPFMAVDVQIHSKKITCLQWHPSAEYILAVAGADTFVTIWNVMSGDNVPIQTIEDVGEMPIHLAWNRDGSILGITSKFDKKINLMLVNPRNGEVLAKQEGIYEGMKAAELIFLNNGKVLTIGADRQAERSIYVWKKVGDSLELDGELEGIGTGSNVMNAYYDYDLKILYLFAKGESNVKYYEIDEEGGRIFYLSAFSATVSQKGGNFMPKRCMITSNTEIARFYKLQPAKCEPVSFIVPRKSEHFQKDLYPDCASYEAAQSAQDWIDTGRDLMPKTMKFGGASVTTKKVAPRITKKASQPNAITPDAVQAPQEVPAGVDLAELVEDMKKVKATVRKLNKRVTKLEEMLEQHGEQAEEEEEE